MSIKINLAFDIRPRPGSKSLITTDFYKYMTSLRSIQFKDEYS